MQDFVGKKILLVDGHSIANRAYYGVPLLSNSKGEHTNALHGFFSIFFKNIALSGADYVGVAFDRHAPTFRHQIFDGYKGTRQPMPAELHEQIEPLQKMLRDAGVPLFYQDGYEADDILGTLAKRYAALGAKVYVLSGDRDLLQLVDDEITLLIPKTKMGGSETEIYAPADVEAKYGVSPFGYLQMKSLMGDSSDNIPGVPGIGEKTASTLIQTYGSLEGVLEARASMKPSKMRDNLNEFEEQARLSLVLSTIEIKADLTNPECVFETASLEDLSFGGGAFADDLKRYELKNLQKQVDNLPFKTGANVTLSETAVRSLDLPAVRELASDAEFKTWLAENGSRLACGFAIDIEENADGQPKILYLAGADWMAKADFGADDSQKQLTLFDDDAPATLIHWDFVAEVLKPYLEDKAVAKASYNSKNIYRACLPYGVQIEGLDFDASICGYLLNPVKGEYPLADLSYAYLGADLPTGFEAYGAYLLREPMLHALTESGQMDLYQTCELPLVPVLASMETAGIRVEKSFLREYGQKLMDECKIVEQRVYQAAGTEFNINSPKQLGEILFEKMGLDGGKKTKTGYSTSADVLEKLAGENPIVEDILTYRTLTKLNSTYVEGMGSCVRLEDGKVHTRFNQTVTATGRLSSTDPNLQNIPIKLALGRELRKAFIPQSKDYIFMDADYSQIELRLLAHMSGDQTMIDAFCHHADIHRQTAAQVLGKKPEDVTSKERSSAKAVNFGIIYGISAFSLSQDLHISRAEAQEYIEKYYAQYPGIEGFLKSCVDEAKASGYAVTLYGRKRPMEELKESNFVRRSFGERVARNMPIQGSAADIIKYAMIAVDKRLREEHLKSRILIQVHDELLLEVYRPEEEQVRAILTEEMAGLKTFAKDLKVPLDVDVHTGEDWYEAK